MTFATSIHNDGVKCFHVVAQETHKLVVMGRINFKNHTLIKRWQACKKMNARSGRFKDEKKGKCRK